MLWDNNEYIKSVLESNDSDFIAETLINELSIMVETLAPAKLIQCEKKYAPWIDHEYIHEAELRDKFHSIAISNDTPENWRVFRSQRNKVNRLVKSKKSNYYNKRLNKIDSTINSEDTSYVSNDTGSNNGNSDNCNDIDNSNTSQNSRDNMCTDDNNISSGHNNDIYSDRVMWRTVKDMTHKNKQVPPRRIIINGSITTSLKKICNHANDYYISKINKLRNTFTINKNISPIQILKFLIPRVENRVKIPHINEKRLKQILKKLKSTNSLGNDIISMKTIKKLGPKIYPYLIHMINVIIDTEIFPQILKVQQISPTLKPDKDRIYIDSYIPINNL